MNFLFTISIFLALFLILFLIGKKTKTTSDYCLGIVFLLYALSLTLSFMELYNIKNHYPFPAFLNLNWLVLLLHGPAIWLYVNSLTRSRFKFKKKHLIHLIPFLFFTVSHSFYFIFTPENLKIELVKDELFKNAWFYKVSVISVGISTLSYNLVAFRLIRNHQKRIKQEFSKIDEIDLNWLKILILASISIYSVNVALFNLDLIFHFASYRFLMVLTYSFASVYVMIIGYFGLKQKNLFISFKEPIPTKSPINQGIKNTEEEKHPVLDKLDEFMEKEKPFLMPELTRSKLAEMSSIKPETISETINTRLNKNFFDYINHYRIEEFKRIARQKENSHLNIMGLAYNSGFNSKAAFYRAFKKFENRSPSEYLETKSS